MIDYIEFQIPKRLAREILECDSVCYSEGIGGNIDVIVAAIFKAWPEFLDEFGHLPAVKKVKEIITIGNS